MLQILNFHLLLWLMWLCFHLLDRPATLAFNSYHDYKTNLYYHEAKKLKYGLTIVIIVMLSKCIIVMCHHNHALLLLLLLLSLL